MAEGCWVLDVYRLSDVLTREGNLVADADGDAWLAALAATKRQSQGFPLRWLALLRGAVKAVRGPLGPRLRSSVRVGSYVCLAAEQWRLRLEGGSSLADLPEREGMLALGRVTEDCAGEGWCDEVLVSCCSRLTVDEADGLLKEASLVPPLRLLSRRASSCGRSRGAAYLDAGLSSITCCVADLVEVKVARGPCMGQGVLVQLDEDLSLEDMCEEVNGREGAVIERCLEDQFDFDAKDDVIGYRDAGCDSRLWGAVMACAGRVCAAGGLPVLYGVSDGSVLHPETFRAHSTCGWLVYGLAVKGLSSEWLDADVFLSRLGREDGLFLLYGVLSGCSVVDGPPEMATSTRAEAQGLLAMLMGIVDASWECDLDLRLDNSSAVTRAGGLVVEQEKEQHSDEILELELSLYMADADMWAEYKAWERRHTGGGATISVACMAPWSP